MRLMMIGKTGCGKTTLCQHLNDEPLRYKKTQAVELVGDAIDTPGEYMENRNFYRALVVTGADADAVLLLHSALDERSFFAPNIATMFAKPVLGLVTKIDGAGAEEIAAAREVLETSGVSDIFPVSAVTGEGLEALLERLDALALETDVL